MARASGGCAQAPRLRRPAARLFPAAVLFLVWLFPGLLHAHGVQEARYSPPIPGWLFLVGGGLAVALSFVLVSLRAGGPEDASGAARRVIAPGPGLRSLGRGLRVAGLLLAALVLASVVFGDPRSDETLAPVLIWSGWWMGLSWVALFIGNVWPALNPWETLRRGFARLFGRSFSLGLRYPRWLAAWPAVFLLIGFQWFELSWFQAQEAKGVVVFFLLFTAWLWAGMAIFDPAGWRENADPFSRYFRVLGRFGPMEKRGSRIELRPPGTALTRSDAASVSEAVFIIVVLFAVTFDGFVATPEWWKLLRNMMTASFAYLPRGLAYHASFLFAMLAGVAIFAAAYGLVCATMGGLSGGRAGAGKMARAFAITLIPIAAAYHIAHFIPALPGRVSLLLNTVSDPFGLGWNLFGTAHFSWKIKWTPDSAGVLWVVQTGLIVAGHIFSIWSAHKRALAWFKTRGRAVRVEFPMAGLMVAYTVISLWIISRPVLSKPLVSLPGISP